MQSKSKKPYTLFTTDISFYLCTNKPTFTPSYLRVNRQTSKITTLTQQSFASEIQSLPNATYEDYMLVMGMIVVNQEPYLAMVKEAEPVATISVDKIFEVRKTEFIPFKHKFLYNSINQAENEKILTSIKDNILSEQFYYCYHYDLTLTYTKKLQNKQREKRYFWNQKLLSIFSYYNLENAWNIPIVQGHVRELHCENDYFSFYYCLISRRSKFMSGTRFNCRGIDESCNSSNYVQTEQIFICHNFLFSHVSLRGSIPIFWKQATFGAEIQFYYGNSENQKILEKHYQFLRKQYGSNIITINLLSSSKTPQKQLKNRFEFHLYKALQKEPYLHFDLNEQMRDTQNGQKLINKFVQQNKNIMNPLENMLVVDRHTQKIFKKQKNIIRVNCLDCIDRTNVVMSRVGLMYLKEVQKYVNQHTNMEQKKLNLPKEYISQVIELWADLGNRISMIYCGTESVATHMTKQQNNSFFSFLSGGFKSLNRYYNASMNDTQKQSNLDHFLGDKQLQATKYFDDNITKGVIDEVKYCSYEQVSAYFLSWNCNNVNPEVLITKDKERLFDFDFKTVEIVVVCLQEMVELSSFNVLLGDNVKLVETWRKCIADALGMLPKKYVYLTCYDLVGIATLVFVSEKLRPRIYRSDWIEVKTGFKGNLGNKGSIVLFLQIDNTFITLFNSHLAAGESNENQRIQDVEFIHNEGLNQRDKRRFFEKSQFRFFVGDLNFRLDAKNQYVRELLYTIEKQDSQKKLSKSELQSYLHQLLKKDEFYKNNKLGSLSTYSEPAIYFLPTYKYVKKEKIYDKKRTPAWCDRILFYSQDKMKLGIYKYMDIDCYLSDHKPICGVFKILVKNEDPDQKKRLIEIYMHDK